MFDAVTGTFAKVNGLTLTNAGDGTFTATNGQTTYTLTYTADFASNNPTPGSGNDVLLTVTVPEPAGLGLLALAGLGLLARRRTRREG